MAWLRRSALSCALSSFTAASVFTRFVEDDDDDRLFDFPDSSIFRFFSFSSFLAFFLAFSNFLSGMGDGGRWRAMAGDGGRWRALAMAIG